MLEKELQSFNQPSFPSFMNAAADIPDNALTKQGRKCSVFKADTLQKEVCVGVVVEGINAYKIRKDKEKENQHTASSYAIQILRGGGRERKRWQVCCLWPLVGRILIKVFFYMHVSA